LWGPKGNISTTDERDAPGQYGIVQDYAAKNWAGLVSDYYIKRWELFISFAKDYCSSKHSDQHDSVWGSRDGFKREMDKDSFYCSQISCDSAYRKYYEGF